jgi:hypothetical protein
VKEARRTFAGILEGAEPVIKAVLLPQAP